MKKMTFSVKFVVVVASLLFGVGQARATVLFGSAYVGGGPASLYSINPATGAATLIGPIGFNQVGAIDFDPATGILYGMGFKVGPGPEPPIFRSLITINTATGAGTEVGPSVPAQDISFRNADRKLYAYVDGHISTIDTSTGAETLVGDTGEFPSGNALAFSAGDTLYHASGVPFGGGDIKTVDQNTGAVTHLIDLSFLPPLDPLTARPNGMDFDNSTGILWSSVVDGGLGGEGGPGNPRRNFLTTIDVASGNVTVIGQTVAGLDALAVQPVQAVPEPGSLALLVLGLAGLGVARRRH